MQTVTVHMRKWKIERVKLDPIIVSQTVGEQALAAWKGGVAVISLPGNISVSAGSITAIEETTIRDQPDNLIGPGVNVKSEVVLDLDGNVMTNWYKINCGSQEWERYYGKQLNYYKLFEEGAIYAAVRLPEYTGIYERSTEWERCTEDEVLKLERR